MWGHSHFDCTVTFFIEEVSDKVLLNCVKRDEMSDIKVNNL
jgi:hypothetical protein